MFQGKLNQSIQLQLRISSFANRAFRFSFPKSDKTAARGRNNKSLKHLHDNMHGAAQRLCAHSARHMASTADLNEPLLASSSSSPCPARVLSFSSFYLSAAAALLSAAAHDRERKCGERTTHFAARRLQRFIGHRTRRTAALSAVIIGRIQLQLRARECVRLLQ